ncbi:MAG: hypothetical protein KJ043_13590 [Anaerolineae bacterium]|nr:hypothetical protein [Anaerolineae bacterium]
MNEQNPYAAEKERHTGRQYKGSTMEVVQLEKQNAQLPSWQRVIVSAFAVIGLLAVIAAIVIAIAGR